MCFIKTVSNLVTLMLHDINEILEDYGEEKAKCLQRKKVKNEEVS